MLFIWKALSDQVTKKKMYNKMNQFEITSGWLFFFVWVVKCSNIRFINQSDLMFGFCSIFNNG